MSNATVFSNLVDKDTLTSIQLEVLEKISDVIGHTAGPYGSYSMLMHDDRLTEYSKDGHKVLSNFKFFRPLERSIHDELLNITEHVIKKVGDGTTTAVQLSYYIYYSLCEYTGYFKENNITPFEVIDTFHKVVEDISKKIRENGRHEIDPEDIYQICMISTNGNEYVSRDIANIYKKYNMDVYIELNTSNTESSILKEYDGIIMNKGFSSPSFINNPEDNTVVINDANLYYFPDPVDTPEMIKLFMSIFMTNIYSVYSAQKGTYKPTVIMCPSISRDAEADLRDIENIFFSFNQNGAYAAKPPFCIITGINDRVDNIGDICTLCDIPTIRKYINPDQLQADIEKGIAPSPETVTNFCGHADCVIIDIDKMKIINPKEMYEDVAPDENGYRPYSSTYNSLISFLKSQIEIESQNKNNLNVLIELKRRYHALTANFVEYYVGGVSASDRDSVKDLVEDAILNCRSAIDNGIGYGAGFEGLRASSNNHITDNLYNVINDIIYDAYDRILSNLYQSASMSEEEAEKLIDESIVKGKPYNIRERSFDGLQVYTSIETDPVILDAISRIITIMYTTNQAFVSDPTQNVYITNK